MNIDKVKIYILNILLIIILFFALFELNISKIILSVVLTIYCIICYMILKKRKITSIYKKQANIMLILFSVIYLVLFYILGLFFGFYKSSVLFSLWSLLNYIIPITVIIISSEIIRFILLSQKGNLSKITTIISMVIIDLIIYSSTYNLKNLDEFLMVMGLVIFSSISSNLLYNYITVRFEYKGIIIYRLITSLYLYIIPFCPDIYVYFRAIFKMVYPYIIYLVFEYNFGKKIKPQAISNKKRNLIFYSILVIVVSGFSMLISCKFKYGMLVIGSGSMTGTINKGDAVIYERYNNQNIKEGQIIIFKKDKLKIIHRVINIKNVNGSNRYYTKGDYNVEADKDYITDKDIIGLSKIRVMYIGYPTIIIKQLFS